MTTINMNGTDYVGYDYKEKIVPRAQVSLYLDSYRCFGWEEDPNILQRQENTYTGQVSLRFRRDRKICNKTELTRLQRNFDGCMAEIDALERSKYTVSSVWALGCGIGGTAFMAGSVFAVTAQQPMFALGVLLAIPGFAGWLVAYFIYRVLMQRQAEKVAPLVEEKYDQLYRICEKGNNLLI